MWFIRICMSYFSLVTMATQTITTAATPTTPARMIIQPGDMEELESA